MEVGDRIEYRPGIDSWYSGMTGRIYRKEVCSSGNYLYIVRWDDGHFEACTERGLHKIPDDAPAVTHNEASDRYLARRKNAP